MTKIKAGDMVILKSGGAQMTVASLEQPGFVRVVWTDVNGQLHETVLPAECFEVILER